MHREGHPALALPCCLCPRGLCLGIGWFYLVWSFNVDSTLTRLRTHVGSPLSEALSEHAQFCQLQPAWPLWLSPAFSPYSQSVPILPFPEPEAAS